MKDLLNILPQIGTIEWIGLRSQKRAEVHSVAEVTVDLEQGLIGDHYTGRSKKDKLP